MIISTFELLVLINQAFYCYSLVPLILEIRRVKTAKGLSDALTWCLFNVYVFLGIYFFSLDLSASYKLSLAIQMVLTCVLIGQRFWYDQFSHKKALALIYAVNLVVAAIFIPTAFVWPHLVGHITGWIGVCFVVLNRVPQIVKVQHERSVFGFNYGFVISMGFAAVMELAIALAYHLPLQTVITSSWSVVSFIIFTAQFYIFSWRSR